MTAVVFHRGHDLKRRVRRCRERMMTTVTRKDVGVEGGGHKVHDKHVQEASERTIKFADSDNTK